MRPSTQDWEIHSEAVLSFIRNDIKTTMVVIVWLLERMLKFEAFGGEPKLKGDGDEDIRFSCISLWRLVHGVCNKSNGRLNTSK